MTIPPFDGILSVLPPHLGDPREPSHLSPYPCSVQELCGHLKYTDARKRILRGLLDFRQELLSFGIDGFQWLDGSFLEDIEQSESRDPADIDVVTYTRSPSVSSDLKNALKAKPELLDRDYVKQTYLVDHFWVPLRCEPPALVSQVRYWYGLFSHRRDGIWKGMLHLELNASAGDDKAALLIGDVS